MALHLLKVIRLTGGGLRQVSGAPTKFELPAHFQLMQIEENCFKPDYR